jgi:glutamate synthase (NADPH/NADH) large chain
MTGGNIVFLGNTGKNLGAGMSGGVAYAYDLDGSFSSRCNLEMIDLDPLDIDDLRLLKNLITEHHNYTKSSVAKFILSDFDQQMHYFVKVFPKEYKKVLSIKNAELNVSNSKIEVK